MSHHKVLVRVSIVLVLLVAFCSREPSVAKGQTTRGAQPVVHAKYLPLPPGTPRQIMNPYFAKTMWKLWAVDPSPVTINRGRFSGTFQPPAPEKRKYPVFQRGKSLSIPTLKHLAKTSVAGFWDDCYMSLDNGHSRLRQPAGQFIVGGAMRNGRDALSRFLLGVNFTTQSYSGRGRNIVDDFVNNLATERHFFFANCVRATPAHISYHDKDPDKVSDAYDGLYGHSYQSLGQSSSETYAVYKMMLAGACMPRDTKNLLKKHGAYAIALLTIFKAALPYADAAGKDLPYEHELRHRVAYSSHGTPRPVHYCSANVYYHGYDDDLHIMRMTKLARELTAAPPVAILKLMDISVTKDGKKIVDGARRDERLKCVSLTNVRVWGGQGETLEVRIDLNGSYDLQKKALSFTCQPIYPNQKNVTVKEEKSGVYRITVKHDPKLPKGRIPVICTVRNGLDVPSNPVFVNFYWPGENEMEDYRPMGKLTREMRAKLKKKLPVNVNRRPIVDLGIIGDAIRCQPDQTVSIDLKATDPEGYPIIVYKRSGEVGEITDGRFTFKAPPKGGAGVHKVHLIFSDGTGGYSSRRMKLIVSKDKDSIPAGWAVTSLGKAKVVGTVSHDAGTFSFTGQIHDPLARRMKGCFVFRRFSGNADLMCRIRPESSNSQLGLLISDGLDDFSCKAGIEIFQQKVVGLLSPQKLASLRPEYLRLTSRGGLVAAYASSDGTIWEQVMVEALKLRESYCAGMIYGGRARGQKITTSAEVQWLAPTGPGLPMITAGRSMPDRNGIYGSPVKITVAIPGKDVIIRYTSDGTQPTALSAEYKAPIKLEKAGRHELRVATFEGEKVLNTVVAVYRLKEPPKKDRTNSKLNAPFRAIKPATRKTRKGKSADHE